jgi:hypothetical protein
MKGYGQGYDVKTSSNPAIVSLFGFCESVKSKQLIKADYKKAEFGERSVRTTTMNLRHFRIWPMLW